MAKACRLHPNHPEMESGLLRYSFHFFSISHQLQLCVVRYHLSTKFVKKLHGSKTFNTGGLG